MRAAYLRGELPLVHAAAAFPLLVAGFVNLAAEWRAGPVSGMGAATIAESVLLGGAVAVAARWPRRLLARAFPFLALLGWAALRSLLAPPTFEGAQNALVYLLFALGLLLAGGVAARDPAGARTLVEGGIGWMQVVLAGVVAFNLALYGLPGGGDWRVGPRSLALVALIPLHWHLARWHAGRARALLWALAWFGVVLVTTARTASAIALVSLAVVTALQARRRPRRAAAGLLALASAFAVAAALVAFVPRFHGRFFSGDTSLHVGEVAINVNGRMAFWGLMLESGRAHPVFGGGLGSSQQVMAAEFFESDNIRHPHNDYLRLWHDLGLVGLGLLLLALLRWLAALAGDARRAPPGDPARPVRLLAGLTLLELLLAMVTDNVLIYPFFMGAAGVIVGAALGWPPVPARGAAR